MQWQGSIVSRYIGSCAQGLRKRMMLSCSRVSPAELVKQSPVIFFSSYGLSQASCAHSFAPCLVNMFAAHKRPASSLSMETGGQDKPITMSAFKKSVCEARFASPTVFALKVLQTPLVLPSHFQDSASLRGILLCEALGLLPTVSKCPTNSAHKVKLEETHDRFLWTCSVNGHKCFRASLCPVGLLSNIRTKSWLAFLHFVNGMRLNIRWTKLSTDIDALFGPHCPKALRRWRALYQEALELYLKKHGHMQIGSARGDVVVFDETNMGNSGGISKAASTKETHPRPNKEQRERIAKRLPAQTLHRPASNLRRPASALTKPAYNSCL